MGCTRTRGARVIAPLLLGLALLGVQADETDAPPMTDEEVVRMFAAGRTSDEIIREIERRRTDFDLSAEMLEELRNVRLPEPVIRAMIERQADQRREEQAALEIEAPASRPGLLLRLGAGDEPQTVSLVRRVDPQLAAEWELGNAPEDRELADLAFFAACLTGDHAPDQWRSKSPLGRDFFSPMPRHELLEFISSGGGEEEEKSAGRRVTLRLPPTIELPLEAGVTHDLMIGLAVQVGGRYRRLRSDLRRGILVGEEELELAAVVRGRSLRSLRVRFEGDEDEDDDDEAGSDDEGP